jgi:hypothetical protein
VQFLAADLDDVADLRDGGRGQNCSSSRQDIWSTASKIGERRRTSGSAPTE